MNGILLPLLIFSAGSYFLVRLRGAFFLHPIRAAKVLRDSFTQSGRVDEKTGGGFPLQSKRCSAEKSGNGLWAESERCSAEGDAGAGCEKKTKAGKGGFRALMLALAGTLGVGNITGVAFGILVGGAGSLFWLFLSGIFSSVLKFAESALAKDSAKEKHGGMAYLLARTFPKRGRLLGCLYAGLCLALCFSMGAGLQAKTFAACAAYVSCLPDWFFAFPIAVIVFFFARGGVEKIEKFTLYFIPLTTIIYIILCLLIIFRYSERIPQTIQLICSEAFSLRSATGGIGGSLFLLGIREGFARGILSNEAGAGTSAMAHARAGTSPICEGLSGALEVFFDTALLCMLTGFAILLPGAPQGSDGMKLVLSVFSTELSPAAAPLLMLLVACFAFATILCWYFYGSECMRYLLCGRERGFAPLFFLAVLSGPFLPARLFFAVIDLLLFLMTALTLPVLFRGSDRLLFLCRREGLLR